MESIASVTGLVQGYGKRRVISGLNLTVRPGVLGILGPNGAGKTTLLRTLAAVMPPQQGTLRFAGVPVRGDAQARRTRRHIGYLPQQFGYFPGFTVYEFVRYCAWLRAVPRREARAATLAALDAVGLSNQAGSKLRSLSGGMLRRCGIAQAILGRPRLLLLDEPTVGLDPQQRLEFRELIRTFTDTATVISTHLVDDVMATCGTVRIMDKGRFVFKGDTTALASAGASSAGGDSDAERGYVSLLAGERVTA